MFLFRPLLLRACRALPGGFAAPVVLRLRLLLSQLSALLLWSVSPL